MSRINAQDDDNLEKAIRAANETLTKIEQQERNFYKTYGRNENDFLNDFISVSKQREEIVPKQFMKRFDQLISDVNTQLKILEAKTHAIPESHSRETNVVRSSNTSTMEESFAPKKNKKNAPSDTSSSTTDLSLGQSDSNQFEQIDIELMQLEQRLVNIEMRIKEDIEAEEIGIEFPIADIIDYVTAVKVTMYKRHLLTNQFHQIVLAEKKFEDEAKLLTKDFVVWTKEKREDLLTKMAQLEESLNKLQQFPVVYGDEFNKYYPLMDDLGLLKRFVSRFLDKYEMNTSNSLPTAGLTSSLSQQTDSISVAKSESLIKETSKDDRKHKISSKGKKNEKHEFDSDIHTAVEKISTEKMHSS
ncbi:hypothetical protein WUBG_02437 [Wuchereria bancrofti]|uniref:Uncharacterized protein n=1 Tax=Wuchereria bancrofti TaxID=6293 RepID=J9BH56_WUCBA|nr:hypothetical protein WUBG_02437 [Wuchereria bancrofti]VDM10322.1 unnamed protein product [Wuchereria bancrofti]